MRIYDREGNLIEITDWQGTVLNDQAKSARVLEKVNGQFRLTPFLFWAGWAGVIAGWIFTLSLLAFAMVLWSGNHESPAWASGFGGVFAGLASFFAMAGLVEYYKKHGVPVKRREKPVELYCKSCQKRLEDDLEVANEQRRAELLIELDSLGGPPLPALEAPVGDPAELDELEKPSHWEPPPWEDPAKFKGKR